MLLRGCCGLNEPKNGGVPSWIGTVAASSNTVLVKLARLLPMPPGRVNSRTSAPSGAISVAIRSLVSGCVMLTCTVAPWTTKFSGTSTKDSRVLCGRRSSTMPDGKLTSELLVPGALKSRTMSSPAFWLVSRASPAAERIPEPSVMTYVPLSCWVGKPMRNVRRARRGSVPVGFGVTVNGPEMGPAGPIMRRICAGVKLPGSMSRSKTTSMTLVVPLRMRLSGVAGLPGTRVLTTEGPVTMSGEVAVS